MAGKARPEVPSRREGHGDAPVGTGSMAERVPIFDSLTHPTLTGAWIDREGSPAGIGVLTAGMERNHVRWALAVGMEGIGGYDEEMYAAFVLHEDKRLIPVAYVNPGSIGSPHKAKSRISRIASLGYAGVKIHPRLAGITFRHPILPAVIHAANEKGLFTLLCTYPYHRNMSSESYGMEHLAALLEETRECRVVLLHGGGVRLLEVIELARCFDNVLVDVSFTLCKYEGSSIDLDLAYAFSRFDARVCIGSDFPDFSPTDLRRRFASLAKDIPIEKMENVAYRNLLAFTGMNEHEAL